MDLFDEFNAAPVVVKPQYRRMTELPLFVPMKIKFSGPYTTVNGPTTKINCMLGSDEVFFFLNAEDHLKFVEMDTSAKLMALVESHNCPYVAIIKKKTCLGILLIPSSVSIVAKAQSLTRLVKEEIPQSVFSQLNLEALADIGILF